MDLHETLEAAVDEMRVIGGALLYCPGLHVDLGGCGDGMPRDLQAWDEAAAWVADYPSEIAEQTMPLVTARQATVHALEEGGWTDEAIAAELADWRGCDCCADDDEVVTVSGVLDGEGQPPVRLCAACRARWAPGATG